MPDFRLDDRVAIVTGGSQGIGRAISLALAAAGADVVIAARTPQHVESACAGARQFGQRVLGVLADCTKANEVDRLVQTVLDSFGRIDILVNNLGGAHSPQFKLGPLLHLTESDLDGCIAFNLKPAFFASKAAAPAMLEQKRGAIINIASMGGRESATPGAGFSIYGATKAALINLSRAMSVEWAPHIRVNCVNPSVAMTPQMAPVLTPENVEVRSQRVVLGRLAEPEDIAGACVFLASDAASYITGSLIDINGGGAKLPPVR